MLNIIKELLKITYTSKQEPQFDLDIRCMLGNMTKMAAPSGLPSRYFIGL